MIMTTNSINAEALYNVTLTKSVRVGARFVHPGPRVIMRGDILAEIVASDVNAVRSYTVEPA